MNCKALFFDLGNVLVDFTFTEALAKLSQLTGKTPSEIEHFFFQTDLEHRFEMGELSPEEFFSIVRERLDFPGSFQEFADIWNNIFQENPQAQGLLSRLKDTYPIVIVSNTNELHFNHVEKHCPVLSCADHLILSYRVRARKPNPDIYQAALKVSQVAPEQAFFVDDLPANVAAAKNLGIHGIHFQGMEGLESQLTILGIL